jgi:hypothetical protein
MTFKSTLSSLRTIKKGDPKWIISDGLVASPRAGFEISKECPNQYKDIISTCINMGWLIPVAYVKDNELFWEEFQK